MVVRDAGGAGLQAMSSRAAIAARGLNAASRSLFAAAVMAILGGCAVIEPSFNPPPRPSRPPPPPVAAAPAAAPVQPRPPAPVIPETRPVPVASGPGIPIGFREYMIDAERAAINTEGLNCTRAVRTPWKEVCIGVFDQSSPSKIYIGGAWINDFVLTFYDGKLAGVEAMFDSRHFPRIVAGITARHGEPTKAQEVVSGGYGVKISADKDTWETPGGLIIVREMAGTKIYSSARFYSPTMARGVRR